MKPEEYPRLVISGAIILYFGYALVFHWSEGVEETLKAMAMIAVGYWLGSSKGSQDNAIRADRAIGALAGSGNPVDVTVVNEADEPVPTKPQGNG